MSRSWSVYSPTTRHHRRRHEWADEAPSTEHRALNNSWRRHAAKPGYAEPVLGPRVELVVLELLKLEACLFIYTVEASCICPQAFSSPTRQGDKVVARNTRSHPRSTLPGIDLPSTRPTSYSTPVVNRSTATKTHWHSNLHSQE